MLEQLKRHLLPAPAVSPPKVTPIPSDYDLLIQCLLGTVHPVQPMVQERSRLYSRRRIVRSLGVFRVVSWTIRLSGALFWMSRFLSCHQGGGRNEWTMNFYYDRPQRGLPVSKRETSTDPGRGVGRPDQ